MPRTIVKCTKAGCGAVAESKIAAPWKDGAFSELKTYGYTCHDHLDDVIAYAEKRPKPGHLSTTEIVGKLGTYALASD